MKQKLYYGFGQLFSIRTQPKTTVYYVEFYTQPWFDRLRFKVYHWYDMHLFKIPGMYWLDRTLYRIKSRHDDPETGFSMPWFAAQDCRCFEYSRKNRVDLERIMISKDQYEKLVAIKYPPRKKDVAG